ncbi:MAG: nitroreductase family protein [Nanoarchaeota archaeon]|nr:nitroreductase family protein [Nanoarchaeota archaeon]
MSHVLEVCKKRRSIRKYLDIPVEWDKVVQILDAGRYAPAAGNLQSWKLIVVTDPGQKRQLAEAALKQYWIEEAPMIFVICAKEERMVNYYGERGKQYLLQGIATMAENMMLTATDLGLGTCWVGAFDEDKVAEAVGCPARARPHLMITIGYSEERVPVPPRETFESRIYLSKYNNRIKNLNLVLWDWSLQMEDSAREGKAKAEKLWDKLKAKVKHHKDEIKNRMKKEGVDTE